MKKILLTISILVSGRKETEKCLESIKPFLKQLPCELILVDTGCDQETRSLCEKYTKQIIPFTWCNDFAKARNAGLKEARGEWFLYLDDDEWFEDPSEMIDFFKTGVYKNYRSAFYIQRNYDDYGEKNYTDCYVSRMVKLEKTICFQGVIHETLQPFYSPAKYFNTYVKHFGYVFERAQERQEHSRRNLTLLLDMTEREPSNLWWDMHILSEYLCIHEHNNLIETAERGIEKCHKLQKNNKDCTRELGVFYGYLAEAYEQQSDDEGELEIVARGLQESKQTYLAKTYLQYCAVRVYHRTQQDELCLAAFEQYITGYHELDQDAAAKIKQGCLILDMTFEHNNLQYMLLCGIWAAVKLGKDSVIERYFLDLDWEQRTVPPEFAADVIRHMPDMKKTDFCAAMVKVLTKKPENLRETVKVLRTIEKEQREAKTAGAEKWKRLVFLFSQAANDHWYITYLKILEQDGSGNTGSLQELYGKLFDKVLDIFNLDDEVWKVAEKNGVLMDPLLLQIDFDKWKNGVSSWAAAAEQADISEKTRLMCAWKKTADIRYDYFDMKVKEALLRNCAEENGSFEELEQALSDFAEAELEFYGRFLKKITFTSCPEILPMDCRFAVKAKQLLAFRKEDDEQKVVDTLREMIGIYPPMNDVLRVYTVKFGEACKKAAVSGEMRELGGALKVKARELMDLHAYGMASGILEQLKGYLPDDAECRQMLEECARQMA